MELNLIHYVFQTPTTVELINLLSKNLQLERLINTIQITCLVSARCLLWMLTMTTLSLNGTCNSCWWLNIISWSELMLIGWPPLRMCRFDTASDGQGEDTNIIIHLVNCCRVEAWGRSRLSNCWRGCRVEDFLLWNCGWCIFNFFSVGYLCFNIKKGSNAIILPFKYLNLTIKWGQNIIIINWIKILKKLK